MPNWVDNRLVVKGPAESIARFIEKAKGHGPVYIPHNSGGCPNVLEESYPHFNIPHNSGGHQQVFSLHALCPVPLNILEESYPQFGYEWELDHWGCKWGTNESTLKVVSPNEIVYDFDTPIGPPVVLLSNLSQEFDDLQFCLTYRGDEFVGLLQFKHGTAIASRHQKCEEEL